MLEWIAIGILLAGLVVLAVFLARVCGDMERIEDVAYAAAAKVINAETDATVSRAKRTTTKPKK